MACEEPKPPTLPTGREAAQLAIIHALNPRIFERARRLEMAIMLVQSGLPRRQCSGRLAKLYGITQRHAWGLIDMAIDMAGGVKK